MGIITPSRRQDRGRDLEFEAPETPARPLTVFAIDDDQIDLKQLRRIFAGEHERDIECFCYTDPEEALKEFVEGSVDVVLLDYRIDPWSGLDVLKQLRAANDAVPVILLTGYGDENVAAEAMRCGAQDYLVKDALTADMLMRSIDHAVSQQKLKAQRSVLEDELRAAQRMESLGTLAGGIAHDFNNLLTGILASAELAMLHSDNEEVASELKRIQDITGRMAELIQRLLSFSRVDKSNARFETIDVRDMLKDIEILMRHTRPRGVEVEVIPPENGLTVHTAPAMLQQILLNLAINALESMDGTGKLEIEASSVVVDEKTQLSSVNLRTGEHVRISIRDTGPGIPPESLERVFEPFFTTKELASKKGTGLGLSIVWQNAKDLGGAVRARNRSAGGPAGGAEFEVFLPASRKRRNGKDHRTAALPRGSETVLVVDDEDFIRETASRMLEHLGYRVLKAADGVEACEVFEKERGAVALVILDISMPNMPGEACFDELKRMDAGVVVLVTTGHDAPTAGERFLAQGAAGVLQKPYRLADFASRVRNAIDSAATPA